MKTIKELEADLKVAIAINNVEWIIQLEAKLQHIKDVLGLIDVQIEYLKSNMQNAYESDYQDYTNYIEITNAKIKLLEELKARITG